MQKRKLCLRIVLSGFLVIILFGSHFVNSETTQDDQCWGILRDTYTYMYDFDYYNYKKDDPLTKIREEITFWDVKSEGNNISFRTDLKEIFLGIVNCESEECYDEYREAWGYDSITDSFEVTYRYDNLSQTLGFIDPLNNESDFLELNVDIPLNPVELGIYLFNYWGGLGFTFLPVSHVNFSFMTDFGIYEEAYSDFEISFNEIFKFKRKKFEGYSYEFSYTYEDQIYEGLYFKQELYTKFSYNIQGVLYHFYHHDKYFEGSSSSYELTRESFLDYSIETYDDSLVIASFSSIYGLSGIVVFAILAEKKRKKRFSNRS